MSHTPHYDAAVAKILAETKPGERVCALTGEKWLMTDEEISWYKKFNVPPSKHSPMTRWKILGAFTIGSQIWYQKHPETGKPFVSSIHPASGIIGLPDKEWYASDFSHLFLEPDFEKNFFDYFGQLIYRVPVPAERSVIPAVNSLALVSFGCEDSYFVLACKCKRTFFALASTDIEEAAEIASSEFVTNSYSVLHSKRIYNSKFIRESYDCNNCAFLFDCRNCEYCFGATNKRNKKYLFFNEQLTKETWENKVAAIDFGERAIVDDYFQKFKALITEAIWSENFNERVTDCSGEYLTDSTRMSNCYLCRKNSNNEFWCTFTHFAGTNNAFCFGSATTSDSYYSIVGNASGCKFCEEARQCINCEYCAQCSNCENCFACVGLNHKNFCLFNKQYSEEEYWILVDKLKTKMLEREEYGEFFPLSFSPSYFPQTCACLFFGADEAFANLAGAKKFDPESAGAVGELSTSSVVRNADELPNYLSEFGDDLLGQIFFDKTTNRRFSYLRPELDFYRKIKIIPPKIHYVARMEGLFKELNAGIFTEANCINCRKKLTIAKNFAYPNRRIYCRECYLKYLEENN